MTPCNVLAAARALPGAAVSCQTPRSRLGSGSLGRRPGRGCGTGLSRAPCPARRHHARRAVAAAAARAPGRARCPRDPCPGGRGAAAPAPGARLPAGEHHPGRVGGGGGDGRRRQLQQQRRRPGDSHLQPAPRPAHPEGGRDRGVRLHRLPHRLPAAARLQVRKEVEEDRKYDIITTPAERVEMAPLNEEDDEDEDSTVFDIKYR